MKFLIHLFLFGALQQVASDKLSYVAEPDGVYVAPKSSSVTSLLDLIDSRADLSNLSAILREPAGFAEAFDTSPTWSFTFLAPSNEAFEHLGAYFSSFAETRKGKWWLGNLINHHYIPNSRLTTSNFNSTLSRVQTASYLYISAQKNDDEVTINSVATVTEANIAVTSGVVHIIDRILDPSALIFESDLPKVSQTFIAGSCSNPNFSYC